MSRRASLGLFEIELYQKTKRSSMPHEADKQRVYLGEGISCALMTRGMMAADEKSISQYEIYMSRFIRAGIRHGIKRFIVVLRVFEDVLCAEIVRKYILQGEDMRLICIDLGAEHNNALPQSVRSRLWRVLDQADEVEKVALVGDETVAEEQALLLADALLFIYSAKFEESLWNNFLCGIVNETMSPNCSYDLKKIWLISLSNIYDA